MKSPKVKLAHTSKSQIGMGDFRGSGIKQKQGKGIDITGINTIKQKKLIKPPKSFA